MAINPVTQLIAVYEQAAGELLEELDSLAAITAASNDIVRKAIIYNQVISTLRQLRGETEAWANTRIERFIEQAARKAGRDIGIPNPEPLGSTINQEAVRTLTEALTTPLENIQASVNNAALRLYRATSLINEYPDLDRLARTQVLQGIAKADSSKNISKGIRKLLQEQFEDGIVEIIGKNGRTYSFGIKEYAEMVAHAVRRQAMSAGTILRAQEMGHDLVRVSGNPSKNGDFCDLWISGVFSISGNHEEYPWLYSIPKGPPPWHPHCTHSIGVYIEELDIGPTRVVPESSLLKTGESDVEFIRRYWRDTKRKRHSK